MKYLHRLLLFVFILASFSMQAQENKYNKSFFKLFVQNDKKEVMLVNFKGSWEIPGAGYSVNKTIPVFLDMLARMHGITIDEKKLGAQVTFHHETRDFPTIMLYYTAHYKGGELKTPPSCEGIKWVPLKDAYELIPYPEMVYIMKKIASEEHTVWGGALKITYDATTKERKGYEIMEELSPLN